MGVGVACGGGGGGGVVQIECDAAVVLVAYC